MTPWETLLNAALLGTERQDLPPVDSWQNQRLEKLLQKLDTADKEATLLRTAGAATILRRAGAMGAKLPVPPGDSAEPENHTYCSAVAAQYLARLLSGEHKALLPIWLKRIATRSEIAPPHLLPSLMESSRNDSELRPLARAVLGKRGVWLARQNADWKVFADPLGEKSTWQAGSLQARREWLRAERGTDDARARELLEEVFGAEPARNRAELLGALEEGLSSADEPFLEKALDDKSKEVRATAADLLAGVATSAYVQRMFLRARGHLSIQKKLLRGASLEVTLPEEVSPEARRDGVDEKLVLGKKIGNKAAILYQYIRAVPPSEWQREFGTPAETILHSAEKTEFSEMLTMAFADAAARHRDLKWLDLFLAPESKAGKNLPDHLLPLMLRALPREKQGQTIEKLITANDPRGMTLLHHHDGQWSHQLSRAVVNVVLRQLSTEVEKAYLHSEFFRQARLALHASVIEDVAAISTKAIEAGGAGGDRWLEFLSFYNFRITMERELTH